MTEPAPAPRALQEEIVAAAAAIRAAPGAPAPRMALFQLSAVVGDWTRARSQLEMLVKLDPEYALFAHVYGRLLDAEVVRQRVFAGREKPVALGEPPAWLAMLAEALRLDGEGAPAEARELRARARASAPARAGSIGEERFAWLMDADPRLGPALEAVVEGQYRWLPLDRLEELRATAPGAMRDLVWQPVTFRLAAGRELGGFVPARYPDTEREAEDAVRLARATRWIERDGEQCGLGQRMLASDLGDHAFLDIRRLRFDSEEAATDG
ncbi:type VI secretion system accessory protein TagJ [Falsiroseomonas sp.]|uniref:type VI secretion system accessory protein TagJ n=1 Tax=Falsiroseomonas sp. TaxID=2870721 RepID=UPI00356366F4